MARRIKQSRNVVAVFTEKSHIGDKRINVPAGLNPVDYVYEQIGELGQTNLIGITENGKWID